MTPHRVSILMVGQYVPSTGLTSVVQNLAPRLGQDHSVSVLALGYTGPVIQDATTIYPDAFDQDAGVWTGLRAVARTTELDVILLCAELDADGPYAGDVYSGLTGDDLTRTRCPQGFVVTLHPYSFRVQFFRRIGLFFARRTERGGTM